MGSQTRKLLKAARKRNDARVLAEIADTTKRKDSAIRRAAAAAGPRDKLRWKSAKKP